MIKLRFISLVILPILLMLGCSTDDLLVKKKSGVSEKVNQVNDNYKKINELFIKAEEELQAGAYENARETYISIQSLDTTNARAKQGLALIDLYMKHMSIVEETKSVIESGDLEKAKLKLRSVLIENPKNQEAKQLLQQLDEKSFINQVTPKKLNPKLSKTVTLEFKDAGLVNIFQAISMTTGINFVLDPSVRQDLKASIFVKDASVEDAINFLLMMHQLHKKVLTDTSVMIFPANRAAQYDDLIFRSFYLNHADAKQLMLLIKQMIPGAEAFVDEKLNMITLKANFNQLKDVERLIANEDIPDPEVLLDVEVMEVKQSKLTDIGATLPNSVSLLRANPSGSFTWSDLTKVNGSAIKLSSSPLITLLRQDGDTNVLANPRIRVRSREKAKIHIGDKIPIVSTTVSGGTAAFSGTSASYLDVGLKLEVEPRVMLNNDVSIKLGLEVSGYTPAPNCEAPSTTNPCYPTINTRNTSTVLMTGDGETQVLAGLISNEDKKTSNKIPGLSQLPLIGRLFTDVNQSKTKTEVVLLITPHVVRNIIAPDAQSTEFYGGMTGRSAPINFNSNSLLQQMGGAQTINSGGIGIPQVIPQSSAQPSVIQPPAIQNQELLPQGNSSAGTPNPGKPVGF